MTSETFTEHITDYSKEVEPINSKKVINQQKMVPKRYHNDKLMLLTLSIASLSTFLIYTLPDWVFLEIPTRDIISIVLDLIGIEHSLIPSSDPSTSIPPDMIGGSFPFLEATPYTPGIRISHPPPHQSGDYWIVKACTGMQAGGLLISIIMVTEAPWIAKVKASFAFMTTLFIGNALRIAFHLWCVTFLLQTQPLTILGITFDHELAFTWAHDHSSKVIGFFGTILFAFVIERMEVPIIDQFADWLDWIWWNITLRKSK